MTMQEMETLLTLLGKAGKARLFDSFAFCHAVSNHLKKYPVQSPTAFLGFYIGVLLAYMTELGYNLEDLPKMEDPIEEREGDRYQIDFHDFSISKN